MSSSESVECHPIERVLFFGCLRPAFSFLSFFILDIFSFISVAFCSREKWASSIACKMRVFIKSEWIVFIGERHTHRSPRCAYVAGVSGSLCRVALWGISEAPCHHPPPYLAFFVGGVRWKAWGGGGGGTVLMLKCCFTATETVGLLGTGAQGGHLNFHTGPELCTFASLLIMTVIMKYLQSANL